MADTCIFSSNSGMWRKQVWARSAMCERPCPSLLPHLQDCLPLPSINHTPIPLSTFLRRWHVYHLVYWLSLPQAQSQIQHPPSTSQLRGTEEQRAKPWSSGGQHDSCNSWFMGTGSPRREAYFVFKRMLGLKSEYQIFASFTQKI